MNNIINLRLAHSAYIGHENNYGHRILSVNPPERPTFLGTSAHDLRPEGQHDTWRFFITFKFGYSKTETFYGTRARNLWSEWKRIQFSKTNRKSNSNGNTNASKRTSAAATIDTQLTLI